MACNFGSNYQYYYPVDCNCYPLNQSQTIYATQCDTSNNNYLQQCYYNAYQNQLKKLQNREITMEYWTRQLEYFRNLLKNFTAVIDNPGELKKLLEICGGDENIQKCFEKRRIFQNIDKIFSRCCCKSCLKKTILQLCNALSISWPCNNNCNINNNKCNCSACQHSQNNTCYYYFPDQTYYQMPSCSCYQQPQQNQTQPQNCYYYCPTTMPNQSNNIPTCCNKCKFNYILNKINLMLTATEQIKCMPCTNTCSCYTHVPKKSCCSIQEIKEETVKIKRENIVENDADKIVKKSIESTINVNKVRKNHVPDNKNHEYMETREDKIENELITSPYVSANESECTIRNGHSENCKVCFGPTCACEECKLRYSNKKNNAINKTKPMKCYNNFSGAETIDDASNISEEYNNSDSCVKKRASIALGEEYVSPSGTFEVMIQDQSKSTTKNKQNSDVIFQVDYTTYTKPKDE